MKDELLDMERFKRGFKAEINARKLLNSKQIKHFWKKDFRKEISETLDWDLINSEKQKIEIKSTINPKSFQANSVKFNTPNQYKNIVFKILVNKKGKILDYKFIRFLGGKWYNITKKVILSPAI